MSAWRTGSYAFLRRFRRAIARIHLKVTEAPRCRRHVLERLARETRQPVEPGPEGVIKRKDIPESIGRYVGRGVNSAKGFCFVDHVGKICPSGFLPLACGQVRSDRLADVYRESPVFRQLRGPRLLEGRCGRCPYRENCGDSRAWAYACTGRYLAGDPACIFNPPA